MKSLGPAPRAMQVQPPRIAEGFAALKLPRLGLDVAEALAEAPPMSAAALAAPTAEAVEIAAEFAETEPVHRAMCTAFEKLAQLPPAQRRAALGQLLSAVAALGTVVAYLTNDVRVELASGCLACMAALISLYWALTNPDN